MSNTFNAGDRVRLKKKDYPPYLHPDIRLGNTGTVVTSSNTGTVVTSDNDVVRVVFDDDFYQSVNTHNLDYEESPEEPVNFADKPQTYGTW